MTTYAGIDLGTTNSAICTYDGHQVHLYKSPEQTDITPSAIFFAPRGSKFFGNRAYNQAPHEPDRAATLFKRLMGTDTPIALPAAGLTLTPEECSAEVLRVVFGYLPDDLRQNRIVGTVITVPAAFNLMQKEATLSAAEQAGIGKVALMQEPVAAVMSVMRSRQVEGRFLIYDLGGGTLDVAIAESIGGRVTLLAHGGIEMCGGRDFDRLIVDQVVLPWLKEQFRFRSDPTADHRIRPLALWAAERAKIELSGRDDAIISLSEGELKLKDDDGKEMYLEAPLNRSTLDNLITARLADSVEAVRETLKKAGLKSDDVERIVFVGGPTHYKTVREYVTSAVGIPAGADVNPMTAVAEGAALFAESIDWSTADRGRKAARGVFGDGKKVPVTFSYLARTPGNRTKLAAKATSSASGMAFQVDSLDSGWSSGRVALTNGVTLDIPLSKHGSNTFKVFLFDEGGAPVALPDDRIIITRTAATIDAIPASHSIGIEVLERIGGRSITEYLVRAGEPLPKKGEIKLRAAESLRAGDARNSLNFILREGEITEPVRDNRHIGTVKIKGTDFDDGVISAGAELLCDYEVLDSGNVTISISVPSIGGTFHSDRNFYSPQEGQIDFTQASQQITSSVEEVRSRVENIGDKVHSEKLDHARSRLDSATALGNSGDPETSKQAMDDVMEAKRLLSEVRQEHLREIRQLELDGIIEFFNEAVRKLARASEASSFDNLVTAAKRVIGRDDGEFENLLGEMRGINFVVLWRQDWFAVDRFNDLASKPFAFADRAQFAELVNRGRDAIRRDDMDTLRQVVGTLFAARVTIGTDEGLFDSTNVLRA